MKEWRSVVGYEGLYEVSRDGCVRSAQTKRARKFQTTYKGYLVLKLSRPNSGPQNTRSVHSLVAEAFLGARQDGLTVNHKDGNKLNNNAANLEWVSHTENALHAIRMGLRPLNHQSRTNQVQKGEDNYNSRLTETDVLSIIKRSQNGEAGRRIALSMQVSSSLVYAILRGERWGHLQRQLPDLPT